MLISLLSLALQYPSDSLESAEMVDARVWKALEQLAGQPHIARGEEGAGEAVQPQAPKGGRGEEWLSEKVISAGS